MANIYGGNGNDSYNTGNASPDNDNFYTALGDDYVQATAGNDSYDLGFVYSKYYWTNSFYDFDTVDYRYANDSYGVGDADIKIVADLQAGTVQKLNAGTGAVLHTDTLVGADAVTYLTIPKAALRTAGFRFGATVLKNGELGFYCARNFTAGVQQALMTLAAT